MSFVAIDLPRSDECGEFDCGALAGVKGLCLRHYHAQHTEQRNRERCCAILDCQRKVRRRGLCYYHYGKLRSENRCEEPGCSAAARIETLCARHFVAKRARCAYGACQSREIFCVKRMLCRTHYMKEYRSQKLRDQGQAQGQGLKFGVPSALLKRHRPKRNRAAGVSRAKGKTVDIDDLVVALVKRRKQQQQEQQQHKATESGRQHSVTESSLSQHSLNETQNFADLTPT